MTAIQAELLSYLPFKRKQTSSGWMSFDAPCCVHNGETTDTRQRGGFISHGSGFTYHCFNCGYKTSWQPGRQISVKNKKLFKWLNVPSSKINEWSLEALKLLDNNPGRQISVKNKKLFKWLNVPSSKINEWSLEALKLLDNNDVEAVAQLDFHEKYLPPDSIPLVNALLEYDDSVRCLEYLLDRGHDLDDYDWHYCPMPGYNDRLIIPFYHQKKLIGYTARKVVSGSPKYLSESQSGYVFNIDKQNYSNKIVLVTEGPFDALAVNGVGLLTNLPNDRQRAIINSLGKTVIVVPDRDHTGMGLVQYAMENEWLVAIPPWEDDIKDASDAFKRYGKLFTIKSILDSATDNKIKLELLMKKYPKEKKNDS